MSDIPRSVPLSSNATNSRRVGGTAKRRELYSAKIKEAEEILAKAADPATIHDMQIVIGGYQKLLARLPSKDMTDNGS